MWTKHSGFKSRAAACLQQFEKKNGAWSQTKNDSNTSVLPHPSDSHTFPFFPTFRVSKRDFCLSDFYKHQKHLYMRNVHTPARKLPASSTSLRSAPIGLHPLGMKGMPWGHLFWPQSVRSPSRLGPSMGREPGRGLLLLKG